MISQNILYLFPEKLRVVFRKVSERQDVLQEIRLRAGKPVYVIENGEEHFLDRQGNDTSREKAGILTTEDIQDIVNHICKYSVYAYEDEIKQGFLSVSGGHRVGIVGQAVLNEKGEVRTLKYISGLNIRVSHQIIGAANEIMPYLYDRKRLHNTIIVSPPGCGKTTILRDAIRQISEGTCYGKGISVGVVDERSELAGSFCGMTQNDLGPRTDVLDGCPKIRGMMMLIRSMSPGVVAVDELGDEEEWKVMRYASCCGIGLLATMHGEGLQDYVKRCGICLPGREELFRVCIVLEKVAERCVISHIYKKSEGNVWECLLQKL